MSIDGAFTFAPVDTALGAWTGVMAAAYPMPVLFRAVADEMATRAVSTEVREALAWLLSLAAAAVAFGLSAWAVLRLMAAVRRSKPTTRMHIQARSDALSKEGTCHRGLLRDVRPAPTARRVLKRFIHVAHQRARQRSKA